MAWGSTYSSGGQNANYQWGAPSLNGQMSGLSGNANASVSGNFDPTTMMNIMRNDQWRQATWNREQELADRAYYQRLAQQAANKGQGGWTGGGQPRGPVVAPTRNYGFGDDSDPMNRFMRTKDRLDRMNEANPAFGHGQGMLGTNAGYFNVPAAGALMGLYGTGVNFTPLVGQAMDAYTMAGNAAGAASVNQAGQAGQAASKGYDTYSEGLRMGMPGKYQEMLAAQAAQQRRG